MTSNKDGGKPCIYNCSIYCNFHNLLDMLPILLFDIISSHFGSSYLDNHSSIILKSLINIVINISVKFLGLQNKNTIGQNDK